MIVRDKGNIKVWHFGVVLLAGSAIVFLLGILNQYLGFSLGQVADAIIGEFYPNIATELAGIALTVLIIDRLYERASVRQEKNRLIRQMGSSINSVAVSAVEELRAFGWLEDGSLQGHNLVRAICKMGY